MNELREMMKRANPDDAKMINEYQQMIKQKTRQMKAMAAELNMYQHQVS
jgi:Spy/CpxP family protein refolding chaperone